MLLAKNVVGLSKGDEDAATKVEAYIDQAVTEKSTADPALRTFSINRADLSKHLQANGVDGLSLKVKGHVIEKAQKAGWTVTEDQDNIVLSVPLPKRGGRPKGKKNSTTAATEPAATTEPVTESPATAAAA